MNLQGPSNRIRKRSFFEEDENVKSGRQTQCEKRYLLHEVIKDTNRQSSTLKKRNPKRIHSTLDYRSKRLSVIGYHLIHHSFDKHPNPGFQSEVKTQVLNSSDWSQVDLLLSLNELELEDVSLSQIHFYSKQSFWSKLCLPYLSKSEYSEFQSYAKIPFEVKFVDVIDPFVTIEYESCFAEVFIPQYLSEVLYGLFNHDERISMVLREYVYEKIDQLSFPEFVARSYGEITRQLAVTCENVLHLSSFLEQESIYRNLQRQSIEKCNGIPLTEIKNSSLCRNKFPTKVPLVMSHINMLIKNAIFLFDPQGSDRVFFHRFLYMFSREEWQDFRARLREFIVFQIEKKLDENTEVNVFLMKQVWKHNVKFLQETSLPCLVKDESILVNCSKDLASLWIEYRLTKEKHLREQWDILTQFSQEIQKTLGGLSCFDFVPYKNLQSALSFPSRVSETQVWQARQSCCTVVHTLQIPIACTQLVALKRGFVLLEDETSFSYCSTDHLSSGYSPWTLTCVKFIAPYRISKVMALEESFSSDTAIASSSMSLPGEFLCLISFPTKDTRERLVAVWNPLVGYVEKWLLSEQDAKSYILRHFAPTKRLPRLQICFKDKSLNLEEKKVFYRDFAVIESSKQDIVICVHDLNDNLLVFNTLLQCINVIELDIKYKCQVLALAPWKGALLVAKRPIEWLHTQNQKEKSSSLPINLKPSLTLLDFQQPQSRVISVKMEESFVEDVERMTFNARGDLAIVTGVNISKIKREPQRFLCIYQRL
jgi:hypothetical protein